MSEVDDGDLKQIVWTLQKMEGGQDLLLNSTINSNEDDPESSRIYQQQ